MKKHVLFAGLLIIVFSGQGNAESSLQFSLAPSFGHTFGETEYILNLSGYQADENGDVITDEFGDPILFQVKSQLEYPLDVVMAGITVGLAPRLDPNFWSVRAGIFTGLSDPGGIMKDHDWLGIPPQLTKWSYTESVPEMNSVLLDIQATRRIIGRGVSALVGFTYLKLEQELFGVEGWQRPYGIDAGTLIFGDAVFFDTLQATQVLYYEVKYVIPQAGFQAAIEPSTNLSLAGKAALALIWFKDVDDHPLRNKLSEADGTGTGFIGSVSGRYSLRTAAGGLTPFARFFLDYTTITASGDQIQTWYGDDPASEDDDTGTRIGGIPHELNATWYHIGVNVGLAF